MSDDNVVRTQLTRFTMQHGLVPIKGEGKHCIRCGKVCPKGEGGLWHYERPVPNILSYDRPICPDCQTSKEKQEYQKEHNHSGK